MCAEHLFCYLQPEIRVEVLVKKWGVLTIKLLYLWDSTVLQIQLINGASNHSHSLTAIERLTGGDLPTQSSMLDDILLLPHTTAAPITLLMLKIK